MTMLYRYDGSFEGFLCAVFCAFERRDRSAFIEAESVMSLRWCEEMTVATEPDKARRVTEGLRRLSPRLPGTVYLAWLSRMDGIDDALLGFIRLGFDRRRDPQHMLYNGSAAKVMDAARKVGGEQHRFLQFLRFTKALPDLYVADIAPAYDVLALIVPHFAARFADMNFIIRDKGRRKAALWDRTRWQMVEGDSELMSLPLPEDGEIEALWRRYFESVAIPERKNRRLQQRFVPLRFRENMTEFDKGAHRAAGVDG